MTEPASKPATSPIALPRRSFVRRALAVAIGGLTGIVPAMVGLVSFLNPLRPKVQAKQRPTGSDAEGYYKVTTLDSLTSGTPISFPIIANRKDAWNTFPAEPIGAVYIQKAADDKLRVFNVTCPHAGCSVDFHADKQGFLCPCHNSLFAMDGVHSASSPSARDLDSLDYKIENGDVLVKFMNFRIGIKEKHAQ